jgi:hypothetical protein
VNELKHADLNDRIARVEQRLERRRARLLADAGETVDAATDTAAKMLPLAAAVGAGLAALWLVRKRSAPRTLGTFRPHEPDPQRRRVRWAQIAGILGSAIRIGTSPQARSLWHNLRARRRRY